MEAETTDVWDFFDKCEGTDVNAKRATCRVCSNIYNYSATIHNLKIHLAKKHNITIGHSAPSQPKPRSTRNQLIWSFFSRVEGKEKFASCHYCDKVLSYHTTTNNLKTHLRKQHPVAYERMLQYLPSSKTEVVEYVEEEYLESNDEDDSSDATKTTTDLWNYFESESATSSICCVCCASVSSKPADLRRHLVTEHPKLIGDYLSQDSDQNDETFSEVIYLEEDPNTKEQKIKVKKLNLNYKKGKRRRQSDEKPSKTVADEEVETFGAYITCLLKQLPREICSSVQKDIIDIILNAKSRVQMKNEAQQKLIKEIMKEINCDDPKESRSLDVSVDGKADDESKDHDGDKSTDSSGDNKNKEVE